MKHCTRCWKDNPAEIHTCSPHKTNWFTPEFLREYLWRDKDDDMSFDVIYATLYEFLKRFDLIKE